MTDSNRLVSSLPASDAADQRTPTGTSGAALATAIQLLTRIPLSSVAANPEALRGAPLFFPLVGAAIGGLMAGLLWLAGLLWPVWLAVALAMALELWLTGALHEDGLADFCDAFGGGWNREKILEILKDSRIGTYGMLGLAFAVALRFGSLVALVAEHGQQRWLWWSAALVASAAVGRWMMVLTMVLIPPVAGRESISRDVAGRVSWRYFAVSGLGAAPAIALFAYLMPINALLACGLIAGVLVMLASLIRRKLGGITGDCLGCVGYVSQVLLLLAAAARVA